MSKSTTRIVIDIEDPKCRNPYCVSAGRSLRSTIRADRMKHQRVHEAITSIGEIPGERLIYDGNTVLIQDRLGFSENKGLREELTRLSRLTLEIYDPSAAGHPREEESYTLHDDDVRATWLIEFIKLQESGAAVVREGTLPSRKEVNELGEWTKCPYSGLQTQSVYRHKKTAKVNA